MATVVHVARYQGLPLQSDLARRMAAEVATAASLGLITNEGPEGFGRRWYVTLKGVAWLEGADL